MGIVCIRGAVTVDNNYKEEILEKTKEVIQKIVNENLIHTEEIRSIIFTTTKDLDQVYPAVAARELGITDASLMCVQEMYVEGSLEKCVRVMLTAECSLNQKELKHIFLGKAVVLRPDLKNN